MKRLFIIVFYLTVAKTAIAQKIVLIEGVQEILIDTPATQNNTNKQNNTKISTIHLSFNLSGRVKNDTLVKLEIIAYNTHSEPELVDPQTIKFFKEEFKPDGSSTKVEKECFIKFSPVPSSEKNGVVFLKISNKAEIYTINLKNNVPDKKDINLNISLVPGSDSINPVIVSEGTRIKKYIRTIPVTFQVLGTLTTDTTIKIKLSFDSLSELRPVLKTTEIKIIASQLIAKIKDSLSVFQSNVNIEVYSVKSFTDDEHFYISTENGNELYSVRVTLEGMNNPNKPFWVEVGSNFDFQDGLKPNNFFGGVFFYKRDIRPVLYRNWKTINKKLKLDSLKSINDSSKNKSMNESTRRVRLKKALQRSNNLAVFAGVYESKTVSNIQDINYFVRPYYDMKSPIKSDSFGIFRDSGSYKKVQIVKSFGLFFSPQVRLTNGSANSVGFHVAASFWAELQWQRLSVTNDFTNMKRLDTFFIPKSRTEEFTSSQNSKEFDIRSHYFGFGLPIFFKEDNTNLFFSPIIGLSNQPTEQDINNINSSSKTSFSQNESVLRRMWRPFYVFQFRLNEERYGITFTGEVRGLIIKNSSPFVSIALTKKFDLTKFIEFQK